MLEWKKLGEVANLVRGKVISKDYIRDHAGEFPVFSSQTANDGVFGCIDSYMFDGDYLTWTTDGAYAGTIFRRSGKFNITNVCGLIDITDENVNQDYLYYWLSMVAKSYVVEGMGNPKLMSNVASTIQIPVPSISEQHRIVGILDTFTASIDNLKQQIEQRRKQYNYCREQLLDLEGKEGVEMKKLGDVLVSLKTGLNPRKNFVLNSPGSKNFYITVRELGHYNITPTDKTDMVTDEALKLINNRSNLEKGDVLFSGTGTIGRTALVKEKPINWNIKEGVYTLKPVQGVISSKFLIELLHSNPIMDKIDSFIVGDPIRSVPMKSLVLVSIPVPSLEEQSRVVGILDTFEASIANLEQQLEMRQKQYEYYRNKLFTFE